MQRMIERYGGEDAIEFIEEIFCLDSESIINILDLKISNKFGFDEKILFPLCIIFFSQHFQLSEEEIHSFIESNTFEKEDDLSGFRKCKNQLLQYEDASFAHSLREIFNQYTVHFDFFGSKFKKFSKNSQLDIFNSLLHMHCNRLGLNPKLEKKARFFAFKTLLARKKRQEFANVF